VQKDKAGQEIEAFGWIDRIRNLGGLVFVDLRDRTATLQIVIDPKDIPAAKELGLQDCILALGKVRERPGAQKNPKMTTGNVELEVSKIEVLGKSKVPPFVVESDVKANEDLRLRYRYLDLRREPMQQAIIFRHQIITAMREYLNKNDFIEIETPILTRSMPEGARDYLVPSRLYKGKFYALAQSPQMYKQLLMVAGFERYYQIARCMRDEDPRHDEDVVTIAEGMFAYIFKQVLGQELKIPFSRMSYKDAIEKYGTDKPDLCFGMEIIDVKAAFKNKDFPPFKDKPDIRALIVKGGGSFSRKKLEGLNDRAKELSLPGIFWAKREEKFSGSIAKLLDENIAGQLQFEKGDLLVITAGSKKIFPFLGNLRNEFASELGLREKGVRSLPVTTFSPNPSQRILNTWTTNL
jgi:aspartyl-tRNA synthetase